MNSFLAVFAFEFLKQHAPLSNVKLKPYHTKPLNEHTVAQKTPNVVEDKFYI
jgi:hypothetical protein